MEIGLVNRINIEEEMQQAYLDYAMSVIVARALPDARDGLKPVHRRILYAMYDMGLRPDTPYKKSARIVGEVLGKYHPHGDMAVYEAMARMAQSFSMRYTLVDGQGNFGSIDGDAPAAMRYTEARLAAPSMQMLSDIQKNTVDFDPNFDGTLTEPRVLPAAIPNLLVNGATGIAVGMATSIPPHNLGEVIDALHYVLEHWEKLDDVSVEDLMNFVQGPDFPTGGIILHDQDGEGLVAAYSTGRGRVTVRASAHLEEMERGRSRIIINELPYMTNKSSLIERIASLVREEKLDGIADLRDESDRQGMRIVIELTKTTNPENVLAELYKNTPMQTTFSMIMLALVEGEPRLLGLKQALRVFIEHRLEIVRRRSEYDLDKARQRAHILEGLRVALQNLDEVISLIRKSPDAETARERLMKRFRLTNIQAQAILDMPLRRLAALERKKIEDEYKEVLALIKELEALLRSPKKMRQVIDAELQSIKEIYADRRRTHIVHLKPGEKKISLLTAADLKPDKIVWVSVTPQNLISRSLEDRQPRLSGKDAPTWLLQVSTRDTLYLISDQGEASAIPVHALPETDNPAEGLPLAKVSALKDGQPLAAIFSIPPRERRPAANGEQNDPGAAPEPNGEGYILTVTRQGMVKKSPLSDLPGPSASIFTLARVNSGDRLAWARITSGKNEILIVTANGMAIRFNEDEVRPMGLVAAGVMGIKLQGQDEIAGLEILPAGEHLLMLASDGSAKRVPMDQFTRQGRYGQGIIAWKLPHQVRVVGVLAGKPAARLIVHLARLAPKTIQVSDAPVMGRAARGQVIRELKENDQIVGICVPSARFASLEEQASQSKPGPKAKTPAVRSASTPTKTSSTQKVSAGRKAPAEMVKEPVSTARKKAPSTETTAATAKKTGTFTKTTPPKKAKAAPAEPAAAKNPPPKKTTSAAKTASSKAATQKSAAKSQPAPAKSGSSKKSTTTAKAVPSTSTTKKASTNQAKPSAAKSTSTKKSPSPAPKSTPAGKPASSKTTPAKSPAGKASSDTVTKPVEKPKRTTTKKPT